MSFVRQRTTQTILGRVQPQINFILHVQDRADFGETIVKSNGMSIVTIGARVYPTSSSLSPSNSSCGKVACVFVFFLADLAPPGVTAPCRHAVPFLFEYSPVEEGERRNSSSVREKSYEHTAECISFRRSRRNRVAL